MTILEKIRKGQDGILVIGNHHDVVQSILDFDHLAGKTLPSVVGIITSTRKAQKLFFGPTEVIIPCYKSVSLMPAETTKKVKWMLNVQSGRRVFDSTAAFFKAFPEALGGHLFAENVPEIHATELIRRYGNEYLIVGPSGVGLLVTKHLKLGAIGGIDISQIQSSKLTVTGSVAVVSTSGGMTNEIIRAVAAAGKCVSFAISIGGDRFPITALADALRLAENDSETKSIVFFGELGGSDEYEIVEMMEAKKLTKPIVCYIAGVIDEAFDEHMQFGHAKALVAHKDESARAKREALMRAGAIAPKTFGAFLKEIARLPESVVSGTVTKMQTIANRQKSILSTRQIVDLDSVPVFVKGGKLIKQKESAFASAVLRALLGRPVSTTTAAFVENVLELLIDNGGQVSGAVNTMVTARAGKDMVASLAAGILTIGPRFGGAVNEAARTWTAANVSGKSAEVFVEDMTRAGELLAGIGHRKYRMGVADPRVVALSGFSAMLKKHPHYDFARAVEKVTTAKNGNLILNVDGVIAALLLDLFVEKEKFSQEEIQELIDAEFFNALFIIPRTVGFIAHYIEQKKNDEGIFRLPDELLFERKLSKKGNAR